MSTMIAGATASDSRTPRDVIDVSAVVARTSGRNGIAVTRANGERQDYAFVSGVELAPGDTITITTANGGGWGRRGQYGASCGRQAKKGPKADRA